VANLEIADKFAFAREEKEQWVGAEDGREAKELPQGGSLRDNVDTSVTLKRT
jgi:hypothetical protein